MSDTAYIVPDEIRAGDTTSWKKNIPAYPPAGGWTLKYFLSDQTHTIDITATDDGTDYLVGITSAGSSAWVPGEYRWAEFVENGDGERHTTDSGTTQILPNLAENVAYDTRTDARIIYDSLITAYKSFISTNGMMSEFSVAGKSVRFKSAQEILDQIKFWAAQVRTEEDAEAAAKGSGTSRQVFVRFNNRI